MAATSASPDGGVPRTSDFRPTIQDAVHRSLTNGTRIADVLRTVEQVARTGAATLVMTYWNPVLQYGLERFAGDLAAAGGAGLITPDITPDSAAEWIAVSELQSVHCLKLTEIEALVGRKLLIKRVTNYGPEVAIASQLDPSELPVKAKAEVSDEQKEVQREAGRNIVTSGVVVKL